MDRLELYNTAHPLAESGKPIFVPFGEWRYDDAHRQRLDRAHGERIANELNARVAKGEPGIPVYQGHPDVPELAAKFPDKGALGWITKIELANEGGKDGLTLTVEWDRDPGKGFRWFSPYWLANEREGSTYIVGEIASIGLVNNPNIREFRLANEEQNMKTKKLNPAIIELAAKYDRLANEANFDESKHPRANDGKFTYAGGERKGSGEAKGLEWKDSEGVTNSKRHSFESYLKTGMAHIASKSSRAEKAEAINGLISYTRDERKDSKRTHEELFGPESQDDAKNRRRAGRAEIKGLHLAAICSGLTYNRTTHRYE